MNRRTFLTACCLMGGFSLSSPQMVSRARAEWEGVEARWYEKLKFKKIKCKLCPRECVIDDRERGYCGVRENRDGIYYTLVHSKPCTYHIDPIEKKPLFHFLPGTRAFSIATAGCNVECKFCQNWQISQVRPEQVSHLDLPPERVVEHCKSSGAPTIAYTYTEPVVFSEYLADTAEAGRKNGLHSVMISNGYIQEQPLRELAGVLDAVKIDLKAMSESFYKDVVVGELKPVLDSLVLLKKWGVWTEIVYLVIPSLNDSSEEFSRLATWVSENLGSDVPVHFSRFFPQYKMQNLPPTPIKTLERGAKILQEEGIKYVYIGNVPGHPAESTYCPNCKQILVERQGYLIKSNNLKKGHCPSCDQSIPGIWD